MSKNQQNKGGKAGPGGQQQQDDMTRKGRQGVRQEALNREAAKSEPQDDMNRKAGQQGGKAGRPEY